MIKIKIHNPLEGKNKQSFLGFLYMREALANPEKISYIRDNTRKVYQEQYTVHNFCMYWYNIFANLENIAHA